MKIRHIVASLQREHGGPSISVPALCSALAADGHDVELLTTEPGLKAPRMESPMRGLEVRFFRRAWPGSISRSPDLRKYAGRNPPESEAANKVAVIHHHGIWLRTLHYAVRAKRLSGAKLVVSPRGMMEPWAWEHRRWRKALAGALIHPGALTAVDGWHATSKEEAEGIQALGFTQPIGISPNGVPIPETPDLAVAAHEWQTNCPELQGRRVALFYSRFHSKKRVCELIELWSRRPVDDWVLLIAGIPDPITVTQLRQSVHDHGATDRILVRDGTASKAPYPAAELLLLPTHSENFGLVVAESMAAGVPVVVTDTTPWAKLNQEGCGWWVPWEAFDRTVAVATAMTKDQLAARGAQARHWMRREFSWKLAAERMAQFYGQLAA